MEWNLGESRARYAVPKDGRGKTLLIVNDAILKGEAPLLLKEVDQILDNDEAWSMMTEKGHANLVRSLEAHANHPVAQYLLGACYHNGKGVEVYGGGDELVA